MPIKSIIVAIDEQNAIGKQGDLLCHLPNDLKYFKTVTQGHTVIMGRKTFESLPKGALPNRRNIVVSRNKTLQFENCEMASSLREAFAMCENEDEVFVIGGGSVYAKALPLVDQLYVTYIHNTFKDTDTYFPDFELNDWEETFRERHESDDKNAYVHSFVRFTRLS